MCPAGAQSCAGPSDCPDTADPCVKRTCDGGCCGTANATDGTACDDSNKCTQTDACQSGQCQRTSPVTCAALDVCHVVGVCVPATGMCSNPIAADSTACNDGSACTQTDTCQAGTCVGTNPVTCTALDVCHVAGTCAPATGVCSNPSATDGKACDDGDKCTKSDACQAGVCTGANPVVCSALDQCHNAGTCNPSTGVCSNPSVPDGTTCDDGAPCTLMDKCNAGVCAGGIKSVQEQLLWSVPQVVSLKVSPSGSDLYVITTSPFKVSPCPWPA
jgi:hypothetical protein